MTRPIYVPAIGQYDNIGDIILRRQLLDWLRELGPLNIYVGRAPDGYSESLGTSHADRLYRSFVKWYASAMISALRRRTHYAFKPGELQLTLRGMKEHVALLPLVLAIKLRKGKTLRIGAGSREFNRLPLRIIRPSVRLADLVRWRDTETASRVGGATMPDLAFGEGTGTNSWPGTSSRDLLVVSMRGDRELPSDAWFAAVASVAKAEGLSVVAVTQVERDGTRSRRLAEILGGMNLPWSGVDHAGHERALRETYRRARLVVSDRLHVLIAAVTEGATPAALQMDASDKIARHFDVIGFVDLTLNAANASIDECERFLRDRLAGGNGREYVETARASLEEVREDVITMIVPVAPGDQSRQADAEKHLVVHIGRAGAVAGGMSQVVNGYLAATFDKFRTDLILTRDGSVGFRAIWVFLQGLGRFIRLPSDENTVVVTHLSQGGSFFREGVILQLARLRGFGCVAQLHGSSFVTFAGSHPHLARRVLRAAHVVHVLSPEMRDAVIGLLPGAEVRLVPNGVDRGSTREKSQTAVFGGAVAARKGVDVLVEAWQRSKAAASGWELVVAGPVNDPQFQELEVDGITLTGPVSHRNLMTMLETSSIAVLPSRDEAMPLFILEALARKNCVISTEVGGISGVLGRGAGVLVPPGDVSALTDALSRMTRDTAARTAISEAGWAEFQSEYDLAVVIPRLEAIWVEALSRSSKHIRTRSASLSATAEARQTGRI